MEKNPALAAAFRRIALGFLIESIAFYLIFVPVVETAEPFVRLIGAAMMMSGFYRAAREVSGRELQPCGSCLSDLAVILANGGKDAFSFGVGRDFGVYGGAHQPDEHIDCADLLEFTKIMGVYILDTLG